MINKKLVLQLTTFNTEDNIDIVDIYVGGSSLATSDYVTSLSGHITGDSLTTYVSTNNFLTVRFTSDKTVEKAGFKATFKTGETWLSCLGRCNLLSLCWCISF